MPSPAQEQADGGSSANAPVLHPHECKYGCGKVGISDLICYIIVTKTILIADHKEPRGKKKSREEMRSPVPAPSREIRSLQNTCSSHTWGCECYTATQWQGAVPHLWTGNQYILVLPRSSSLFQAYAPGRGLTMHMNWHKRNITAMVVPDTRSRCRICGKLANSPSSLAICEKSHKKWCVL